MQYRIRIRGELKREWSDWFSGLTISMELDGHGRPVTALVGPVADQAALRGILNRIWNLNLTVLAVQCLDMDMKEG